MGLESRGLGLIGLLRIRVQFEGSGILRLGLELRGLGWIRLLRYRL